MRPPLSRVHQCRKGESGFSGENPVNDPVLAKGGNYVREEKHLCLFLQENKWLFYSEGGDGCLSIALSCMCFCVVLR